MAYSVSKFRRTSVLIVLPVVFALSGCATAVVGGAVVGTAATVTKYAVKGTVGAGKLAYRGTKAAVKGTAKLISSDDDEDRVSADLAADSAALPPVDD